MSFHFPVPVPCASCSGSSVPGDPEPLQDFNPAFARRTLPASVLVDIARCWRSAREDGEHAQPSLAARLDLFDCAMLAPVIDSFCLLFEAALGRPMRLGLAHRLSSDERLMVSLLEGPELRPVTLACAEPRGTLLDGAIHSTRLMIALTLMQARKVRVR
ncbi:hypothetical protein [Novosphingobium lindaniclasticum]